MGFLFLKRSFKFENPMIFILMAKFKERNFILKIFFFGGDEKRVDSENVLRKIYLKFSWDFSLKKKKKER